MHCDRKSEMFREAEKKRKALRFTCSRLGYSTICQGKRVHARAFPTSLFLEEFAASQSYGNDYQNEDS